MSETFDTSQIRELAEILNETGLTEIELDRGGVRIRVARTLSAQAPVAVAAPAPVALASPQPTVDEALPPGDVVTSPMVGTVYMQAQPGAEPFVREGDTVAQGQTLLLVEAMKTLNPIAAPRAGRLLRFLVADSQPVEYGEPLAVIG